MLNPQLNRQGRLVHLLSTEGLSRALLTALLDAADRRMGSDGRLRADSDIPLSHWRVALWREEGAALPRDGLGAGGAVAGREDDPAQSREHSMSRLADAAALLGARVEQWPTDHPAPDIPAPSDLDLLVMRHRASGAAHWAARRTPGPRHIVNAGDGAHEDPVSGLTMVAALRRALPDLTALTVTLVGNLNASAAGRSCLHILTTLGVPEVRLATPPTLAPEVSAALGVQAYVDVDAALVGADVVVVLPMAPAHGQSSRHLSACEYRTQYGVSRARLTAACPAAVVLLADGLESTLEVADDVRPLPLDDWGRAVSLAVLHTLVEGET